MTQPGVQCEVTDAGLLSLTSRCPNLIWLDLRHAKLSADVLLSTLETLPRLQCLDNDNLELALNMYVQKYGCKPLNLTVFRTSKVNDTVILDISSLLPKLQILQLNHDIEISKIIDLTQIKELIVTCKIEHVNVLVENWGKKLLKLEVNNCVLDLVIVARYCINLQVLTINTCESQIDDDVMIWDVFPFVHFRKLRELTRRDTKVPTQVLCTMFLSRHLNSIYLEKISLDESLQAILPLFTLPKLEFIKLIKCEIHEYNMINLVDRAFNVHKFFHGHNGEYLQHFSDFITCYIHDKEIFSSYDVTNVTFYHNLDDE